MFFFFFKQKTAYEMRISDWSSDVCSSDLAGETCPVWPGNPITAHWGIEDPAAVEGPGQREAFERVLHYLSNRISLFLAPPHDSIAAMAMERKLTPIGRSGGARPRRAEGGDTPPSSSPNTQHARPTAKHPSRTRTR